MNEQAEYIRILVGALRLILLKRRSPDRLLSILQRTYAAYPGILFNVEEAMDRSERGVFGIAVLEECCPDPLGKFPLSPDPVRVADVVLIRRKNGTFEVLKHRQGPEPRPREAIQ